MKCIICNAPSFYFFSKTYTEQPFATFMRDIGTVDYEKCGNCGFVFSTTHREIDKAKWEQLNRNFHEYVENPLNEKKGNQPPYAEQALMIQLLSQNEILDSSSIIDFGAGYGTLSALLVRYFGIKLPSFDPYLQLAGPGRHVSQGDLGTYKTVINSAVFEHVLSRDDLDAVNDLVDAGGSLVVHTVIRENIPKDPDWFYLRPPVHTAFHTNSSMRILMAQWGYRSSIYCPQSKCWVLMKDPPAAVNATIDELNKELQSDWFFYKDGFVDYWKD